MAEAGVLGAAKAFAAGSDAPADQLVAALNKAAAGGAGKENGPTKQLREAALQCFKACQQRLAQPGGGGAAAAAAAVGRASLAVLAASSPASAAQQVAGWRYNLARRLVSCKAFGAAHAEATLLFQHLAERPPAAATAEEANLAVGTVLTLVLCCVEGRLLGDPDALSGMVQAAHALPPWLRWVLRVLLPGAVAFWGWAAGAVLCSHLACSLANAMPAVLALAAS